MNKGGWLAVLSLLLFCTFVSFIGIEFKSNFVTFFPVLIAFLGGLVINKIEEDTK